MSRALSVAAVAVLLLAGCAGGEPAESPEPEPTARTSGAVTVAPGVAVPETRAGLAAQWVLDQLAASDGPDATEASEHFDDSFLSQVPASDVAAVFAQLRAAGPFLVEEYSGTEDAGQLPLEGPDDRFVLHVATGPDGRMSGMFFAAAEPVPDVGSLEDLEAALAELPAETSLLVAEVDDGTCRPLHAREADQARPIGSTIKLYVLDAVRHAVAAGELSWQDTLTLTDDLRSLPSGVLQDEPAGTEVSVAEAAEGMIAISDNTATDLLIDAVGRPAVLDAVARLDHHDPALLEPLLTTRDLFQLGFTDLALRERWTAADGTAEQQAILETLPGGEVAYDETLATDVVWDEGLDWFATAEDLCHAHVGLQETAAERETVRDILAANPGIEVPEGWDYVAFKGGSAPGEMAGSWYLEGDAGDHVVVLQIAGRDVSAVPDAGWLAGVVTQTAELLAKGSDR